MTNTAPQLPPVEDLATGLSGSFEILAMRYCRATFRVKGCDLSLSEVAAIDGMLPIVIDQAAGGSGANKDRRLAYGLVVDKKALMEVQVVIPIRVGDTETPQYWEDKFQEAIDAFNELARENGGIVDLDERYDDWFRRLHAMEIVVGTSKPGLLEHFDEDLPPIVPASAISEPAVSREEIASYLVKPVVAAILDAKRAHPRPTCFLVQTSFTNFQGDLAKALSLALDPILGKKPWLRIDREHESDVNKNARPSDEIIVDVLSGGGDAILVGEGMRRLPVAVRELVGKTLSIERFDMESLESAIKELFDLHQRPLIKEAAWVRLVRPSDLLVNAFSGANVVAELQRTVEHRLALVEVGSALTLDQLQGMPEAKEWARQLIEDIRLAELGPLKGGISWADVDRGALFEGPPGVGKTSIARAIAKSCGLKFINASAAAWQATGHLNDHLAAMRASFALAAEYAPSLIFIDEIDSIGNRENFSGDNQQYQTEVVNALLQELDGFEGRQRIIVLAATNYAGNVDKALRRPGRLDRVLNIPYPNAEGLRGIYQHYLSNVPHTLSDEDFNHIARTSLGLTGADVELFVRSARRDCRRNGRSEIAVGDLLRQVFRTPPEHIRQPIPEAELHRTAVHEAGHVLLRLLDPDTAEGLSYASIIPRSDGTMGFVASFDPNRSVVTTARHLNNIAMTLAGRAAEAMVFGEANISMGAGGSNERCDLASATRQVEYLLTRQGFGSSSKLLWRRSGIEDSTELREQANTMLQEQYDRACQCLKTHRAAFDAIVEKLLEKQEVTGDELHQLVAEFVGQPVPPKP